MALSTLYNVPKDTPDIQVFSFCNQDSHNLISAAFYRYTKILVPTWLLDPIPLQDIQTWARRHQEAHNVQNELLGIIGNDLVDVDWNKPAELANWIFLHAEEHYKAYQALSIQG